VDTTLTALHARADKQPLGFRTLVIGALIGFALLYVFIQAVLIKRVEMPLPVFSVISLVLAALVAGRPVGGWRWTPLLGGVWGLVLLFGNVNLLLLHLSHPEDTLTFSAHLVQIGLSTTAVVAGVAATVQSYRRPAAERRLPRWVRWGYIAMAGLFVGAVAVASIPRTGSGVQVQPAVLAQLPLIPLDAFNGGEIRVRAGQLTGLRLENSDAAAHSFDVDELDIHVAMPGSSESVALFKAATPGTYTFYCAPHYDKATGRGMRGTLIVEP
jgi:plastocyanin